MKITRKLKLPAALVAISTITIGAPAAAATAATPVTSIQMSITASPPASAPFTGPFTSGLFTAYSASGPVGSGPISGWFVLPAQPPQSTQIETFRTLTSYDENGTPNGTLRLHCSEISRPPQSQSATGSALTGSCAVQSATGVYAGLRGTGSLSNVQVTQNTLTDTLAF